MDSSIISIGVLFVVLGAAVGGFVYVNMFHDDGEEDDSFEASDLTAVANAFITKYEGGFDNKFILRTTEDTAKVYYIEAGMKGDTEYYVSYKAMESADEALDMYETQQKQYAAKVGPTAMAGLEYFAYEEKAGFDEGYGYYGVCTGMADFVTLHYCACFSNVYIEASLYDNDGTLETAPIAPAVEAMFAGFDEPAEITASPMAYNFAYLNTSGTFAGPYEVTIDGNSAKAAYSNGYSNNPYNYVQFTKCESADEAKELYETQQKQYAAKVEAGSAMAGMTFYAYEKHGNLAGGYGYYGDINMTSPMTVTSTSMNYCAYQGEYYITAYFYINGINLHPDVSSFDAVVEFIETAQAC
ncbi:MAG: hypothetical protein II855_02650 [Candidatus Methanomethylophilaceae archaeon]|nr:hypothetical protein [Candidatus Methanomethylophilaceae archaeon]